jgi:hypothetical protein
MKPKFKPPGTKRLKLEYDGLLSSFAFKFNLRRYTMAELRGRMEAAERDAADSRAQVMRVEGAAAAAAAGARESFEQVQQRVGAEQGGDARRLDALSSEAGAYTRSRQSST